MKLNILSGLPGTGKSSIAERLGRAAGIPVFPKDWLEATLLCSGLQAPDPDRLLGQAGCELLTVLAELQLPLGQSAILDSVATTASTRQRWKGLAEPYSARWRVLECICLEEPLHRPRLQRRRRGIPGWHELDWTEIERVRANYIARQEPRLVLDIVRPFEESLERASQYCE